MGYTYIFVYVKFFKRPKIPELDKILGVAITLGLVVYLIDSFLNFPLLDQLCKFQIYF